MRPTVATMSARGEHKKATTRGALLLLCAAARALSSCTVDTELGLAADVSAATLTVNQLAGTYHAQITVDFRVGAHATGVREFAPLRLDATAGAVIGTASSFTRPPGFSGALAPGESRTVTFTGDCLANCRATELCAAGGSVPIDFFWEDRGVSPPELGQASGTATVNCPP
jgi:hypothetical protein